jgi:hypothetical protein
MSGFFEEDRNLSAALNQTLISVLSRTFPRHYTDSAYPIEFKALVIGKGFYFVTTCVLALGPINLSPKRSRHRFLRKKRAPNLEMISHFLLVWRFINRGVMILLLIDPYGVGLRGRKFSVLFIYLLRKNTGRCKKQIQNT